MLLSGGETTVSLRPGEVIGRGGRNVEFLLAFGLATNGHKRIIALACDTDGIDGLEDIAGAIWMPDLLERAKQANFDPRDYLMRHDAHSFFEHLGHSVITGPTCTNVNDFRAILIMAP